MPAFPLHGWMPDAYLAAPPAVLALLSGVLSKVAAYGFLRVVLPIFPNATVQFQELILVIATVSILYGSAMAFTQTNVRLIAGYSSIAQLGFITLGVFSLTADGANGAILQMVNHAIVVVPLFLIIVLLAERFGSEDLKQMGGGAMRAPVLAALFLIVTMATLAMPGSANFIGEFYILNGLFDAKTAFAVVATAGIAMAAFYALRMYQRSMHNRLPAGATSRELGLRDGLVLVPLVGVILVLALTPGDGPEARRGGGAGQGRRGRRGRRGARGGGEMTFTAPDIDYAGLSPIIALTAGLCVVLLAGLVGRAQRRLVSLLSFVTLGAAAGLSIWQFGESKDLVVGRAAARRAWPRRHADRDRLRRVRDPAELARGGGRRRARAPPATASSRAF